MGQKKSILAGGVVLALLIAIGGFYYLSRIEKEEGEQADQTASVAVPDASPIAAPGESLPAVPGEPEAGAYAEAWGKAEERMKEYWAELEAAWQTSEDDHVTGIVCAPDCRTAIQFILPKFFGEDQESIQMITRNFSKEALEYSEDGLVHLEVLLDGKAVWRCQGSYGLYTECSDPTDPESEPVRTP